MQYLITSLRVIVILLILIAIIALLNDYNTIVIYSLVISTISYFISIILIQRSYIQNIIGYNLSENKNTYKETETKKYFSGTNRNVGVLLVHGYSASTGEFRHLMAELEKKNISYIAPLLKGFGERNNKSLSKINYKEWIEQLNEAWLELSQYVKRIEIVGHSMGGLLSLHLSTILKVNNIVMTAPYLFPKENHNIYYYITVKNKIVSKIFEFFVPIIEKRNLKIEDGRFVYKRLPFNTLRQLWLMCENLKIEKLNAESIATIYAELDNTIDNKKAEKFLQNNFYSTKSFHLKNSGHNLLEDVEREEAIRIIFNELNLN